MITLALDEAADAPGCDLYMTLKDRADGLREMIGVLDLKLDDRQRGEP